MLRVASMSDEEWADHIKDELRRKGQADLLDATHAAQSAGEDLTGLEERLFLGEEHITEETFGCAVERDIEARKRLEELQSDKPKTD